MSKGKENSMRAIEKKSRILGLAFLIQFVTSFTSGVIVLPMATGVQGLGVPEDFGRMMASIGRHPGLIHLSILLELVTAAGVIFLGAMLYSALRRLHEGLALTAFGLYVLEAALIAASKLALFALLAISRRFIAAGSPASMEPTARLVYEVMEYGSKMLNLAFCLGGTIFYALLVKSRIVALPLSLWGLISAQGVFAGVLLGLFGAQAPVFLYVLYIPFEFSIGGWILVKGLKEGIGAMKEGLPAEGH
jgi:hypothetical protein